MVDSSISLRPKHDAIVKRSLHSPYDRFEWEGVSLEVVDMDGHRVVDKVLVARTPDSAPADDAPQG